MCWPRKPLEPVTRTTLAPSGVAAAMIQSKIMRRRQTATMKEIMFTKSNNSDNTLITLILSAKNIICNFKILHCRTFKVVIVSMFRF